MSFTAESSGGEYKHKLSADEMPSHYHNVVLNDDKNELLRIHYNNGTWGRYSEANRNSGVNTSAVITNSQGGSKYHNNLSPYITVYFWRRTA